MRKLDITAALILLGLSVLVVLATWHLPYWSTFAPGPAFAAFWVAGAGGLIAAILLLRALRADRVQPADWPDRDGARQVLLGIAALCLLFLMLPLLGTLASGLIFMLVFLIGIARRRALPSLLTSALTVAIIESVFGLWLNIDLPKGIVGF